MNLQQLHLPLSFRHLATCSAARADDPDHHLRAYKNRPFWMKVRVDQGPKFVGKDVYIPLVTRDVETACRIRDGVLHGLKAGGFILSKIETPPDL